MCRSGHSRHHVIDTGTDVIQGVGHRGHWIEFAAAVAEPQLSGSAQGDGDYCGVGRYRDRFCSADFVVPQTVLGGTLSRVNDVTHTQGANQQHGVNRQFHAHGG